MDKDLMGCWWLNGQLTQHLAVTDRGLNYGDGLFTTLRIDNHHCQWLQAHLQRLRQGAQYLQLPAIDWALLEQEILEVAASCRQGALKVMLTRGSGGRGYSALGCEQSNRLMSLNPLPAHYARWRQQGVELGICAMAMGLNPALAGIKHLNRLEQVLARQEIDEQGWADGILLDIEGFVVECHVANIFWRYDEVIYTPSLAMAGVDGIVRQQLIALWEQQGKSLEIGRYPLDHLMMADEVWISNSLMGLVPVNAVDGQSFAGGGVCDTLWQQLESNA